MNTLHSHKTDTVLLHDRDMIAQSLAVLAPEGVVELRALNVPDSFGLRVVSGYFDADHRAALVEAVIKQCAHAGGVYITLQHVLPDCLARCLNRARTTRKSDPTTRDEDVIGYRWLPLDFDPVRPAGISSNEDEHDVALSAARSTRDALTAEGWPDPVMIDSGNGAHLLYKLPLGWGSSERVQKTLKLLSARFSTARVLLDEKVFNPARIWKLPGSVARKGDSMPSRPHRLSRLLAVPETVEALSLELLDRLLVPQSTPDAAKATPLLLSTPPDSSRPSSVQIAEKQLPKPLTAHQRTASSSRRVETSVEKIESALEFIPADDRDTWLCVGEALHHWGGSDARALWDQWSMSSSKFDPEQQDKTWNSFRSEGRNGKVRTLGSVFYKATQAGWQNSDRYSSRAVQLSSPVDQTNELYVDHLNDLENVKIKALWPNAPVSNDAVMPKDYLRVGEGLAKRIRVSSAEDVRIVAIAARPAFVIARLINEQGKEFVRIAWPRGEEWRQVTVLRDTMVDKSRAIRMADSGCPITTFNAGSLTQWFAEYEEINIKAIPQVCVSSQMGWHGEGASRGFLLGDSWISPDQDQEIDPSDPLTWNLSSWTFDTTKNSADIETVRSLRTTQGSFEAWLDIVKTVVPFPRVLLALYASFAAPLVEVLQRRSIIIDWIGSAHTGKTTILALAASVWADPDDVSGTFVRNWPATAGGLERMAAFFMHLPLIINDSSKFFPWISGRVTSGLTEGSGKTPGAGDDGQNIQQSWRTVILSSGEERLVRYATGHVDGPEGGTNHRIIQLDGDAWGGYRPEVRNLEQSLRLHHGHAGRRWLQWLVAHRSACQSQWISRWSSLANQYRQFALGHVAVQRMGEDLAVIQLAAELVHEALSLPWSVETAKQTFLQIFDDIKHNAQYSHSRELALECVWNWCVRNIHLFDQGNGETEAPPQGWVGRWSRDPSWQEIIIDPSVVRDILQSHKLQYHTILREWSDADWIRRGDGRHLLAYVSICGKRARYVVIKRFAIEQACMDALSAED